VKLSPFIRDIVTTTVTSFLTIIALVVVTRLLAEGLGPEGFGAYSLARRILSTVDPFSTVLMGVAVTRFVALTRETRTQYAFLVAGIILGVIPSMGIFLFGYSLKSKITLLVFHSESYMRLMLATLIMIVCYSFFVVLYGFYRGMGRMEKANVWQLGVIGIGPVIIAWVFADSGQVDTIILLMAILLGSSILPLAFHTVRAFNESLTFIEIRRSAMELFRYGFPRVPGGVVFAGLLAIGPFLAPYFGTLKDAGYFVAGQSLLRVVEGVTESFGRVALAKAAMIYADQKTDFLGEGTTDIIAFVIHLGVFATAHLIIWSDQIVLMLLGVQYTDALPLMRVLLIGLTPFLAYSMLRSIIDAVETKAVNTIFTSVAFVIALAVSFVLGSLGFGIIGLGIGSVIGFVTLGGLTVRFLWKKYRLNATPIKFIRVLFLNIALIIIAILLRPWLESIFHRASPLVIAGILEASLAFVYLFILWKWKVKWMTEIERRISRVSAPI
jgi:O-antigen/teichoic acid export membrane protein